MWETLMLEVLDVLVKLLAAVALGVVVYGANIGIKFLNRRLSDLGIDIAEWEVWTVAKSVLRAKGEHEGIVEEVLGIVADRLSRFHKIEVEEDELMDMIRNALEDLKKEG